MQQNRKPQSVVCASSVDGILFCNDILLNHSVHMSSRPLWYLQCWDNLALCLWVSEHRGDYSVRQRRSWILHKWNSNCRISRDGLWLLLQLLNHLEALKWVKLICVMTWLAKHDVLLQWSVNNVFCSSRVFLSVTQLEPVSERFVTVQTVVLVRHISTRKKMLTNSKYHKSDINTLNWRQRSQIVTL